jgi:uncharacterized protein involved in outer membrane biogenesis
MLVPTEPRAPSFLQNLRASGKVNVGRFADSQCGRERVSASLELERGRMKVSDLRAELLGGKHRGDWQADFTAASPVYSGSGTVTGISLEQVASAMHDPWISGTGGGHLPVQGIGNGFRGVLAIG